MTKSVTTILLFLFILTMTACSDNEQTAPVFEVRSEKTLIIGMQGGNLEIPFIANNPVKVTCTANWVTHHLSHDATLSQEGMLTLTIDKNTTKEDRTTHIQMYTTEMPPVHIIIEQEGTNKAMSNLQLETSNNKGLKETVRFFYDSDTRTYSGHCLKWIESDTPDQFVPTFQSKGKVTLEDGKELISGKTVISLAKDIRIKVTLPSGNTEQYTVSLNCPQINNELPVLHMKPEKLIADKENYVDTEIELFDKTSQSTGEGWWNSKEKGTVEMRGRGNSTWRLPKKPFRIKFTEKFSPIGLNHAKAKSWTLLAQDMDKSLLRTHLAFEYSRLLFNKEEKYHDENAILFTPCSRYVNVYYTGDYPNTEGDKVRKNGEYIGVYQMSDQMEQAKGRIDVEKLEEADGDDPEKITGGYIVETDVHDGTHYTALKHIKMSYKYPKDDDCTPAQYAYITHFLNEMESTLFGSNYKDAEHGWRKYLDIKTLADFIIIKELAGDADGYTSTYLYKRRGVDKLFFGPIWDCDKGWDNEKRVNTLNNLIIKSGFGMPGCNGDDWYDRLWEDETLRRFVGERWKSKRDELLAITEKVLTEVPAAMDKSIEANFTVWKFYYQYSNEAKMPAETYEKEIERIRKLTKDRATLLDRLFK